MRFLESKRLAWDDKEDQDLSAPIAINPLHIITAQPASQNYTYLTLIGWTEGFAIEMSYEEVCRFLRDPYLWSFIPHAS